MQEVVRKVLERKKLKCDKLERVKKIQHPTECDELLLATYYEHRLGIDEDTLLQSVVIIQATVRMFIQRLRYLKKKLHKDDDIQLNEDDVQEYRIINIEPANITRGFLIKRNFSDEVLTKSDKQNDATYKIRPGANGPEMIEIAKENPEKPIKHRHHDFSPERTKIEQFLMDNEIIDDLNEYIQD